jgi:adenylate cyclase
MIATCAADGTPNVSYASQVHYVDRRHVALTFQFFNKTHENILVNPRATVFLTHPDTVAKYLLHLKFQRCEEAGPLFESMKARLAGIASHTGMAGVFRLRGSDVYEVLAIERVPGPELPMPPRISDPLAALRALSQIISVQTDLAGLLDSVLLGLRGQFGIDHSMVLLTDAARRRLFTVASCGYPNSGVGAEIEIGQGVIGVAAQHATAIRINHMTQELAYSHAIRSSSLEAGLGDRIETEIPMPGLPESRSQLAVPIILGGRVAGVLYVESPLDMRFNCNDEDALTAVAAQVGLSIAILQASEAQEEVPSAPPPAAPAVGAPAIVRLYRANDSVFIDDDYLIKGVAGSIFAKLVRDYTQAGRSDFSNRELRLDHSIRLPDITDNLEARLILLARRLAERCEFIAIEKTGRGRFRLRVTRPLKLVEVS